MWGRHSEEETCEEVGEAISSAVNDVRAETDRLISYLDDLESIAEDISSYGDESFAPGERNVAAWNMVTDGLSHAVRTAANAAQSIYDELKGMKT